MLGPGLGPALAIVPQITDKPLILLMIASRAVSPVSKSGEGAGFQFTAIESGLQTCPRRKPNPRWT